MEQLQYVLRDLRHNKRVNIFFMIQITIVIFLISLSISDMLRAWNGWSRMKRLRTSSAYILGDYTDEEQIHELFQNESKTRIKMQRLYQFTQTVDVSASYAVFQYLNGENYNGISEREVTGDKNFFEFFDLDVISGQGFSDADYQIASTSGTPVPVLVGYQLQSKYKVGSIYDKYDCGTGEPVQYRVIGTLRSHSCYYEPGDLSTEISLDYAIVKPIIRANYSRMSFSDIDMLLSSTVFFTDQPDHLNAIADKSRELGLMTYRVLPVSDCIDDCLDDLNMQLTYKLTIAVIILLFSGIGMSASMNEMLNRHMREYSIHRLCGGRYTDIGVRLVLQVLLVSAVSMIPVIMMYKFSFTTLLTLLCLLMISGAILLVPLIRLGRTAVSTMLRRAE